jgi:putative membrane-bound dehydrogenase-like protein
MELVAEAPRIKHPSVVACAPDGRVFVAEDPMDISLPKADATEGRILCLHPDGRLTVFAEGLYAVFGMQYLEGMLYVVHAPKFSVFTDDAGVGRDRVDLIESLNPKPWALDWNDHVPANFRLAMDGYFYMAVGDKGLYGAVGRDGKRVDLHGGGILRLRPDGTGLEVYCRGVRNILDVAINADDEVFTYDNTDEQQWMSRVTHMVDGGFYGYPYDFIPRRSYTLWCMADYGGGAATGTFCYNEDALPPEYHGNLFLADFGKRQLLRLRVAREGATFKVVSHEDLFRDPPEDFRPVGIAQSADGMSIYICDWHHRDTKEVVSVGRLWKLSYTGKSRGAPKPRWYLPAAIGKKFEASNEELLEALAHPAQGVRFTSQRECSRRGTNLVDGLIGLVNDHHKPALAQQHALWALDAIDPRLAVEPALNLTRMSGSASSSTAVVRQSIRFLGERRVRSSTSALLARLEDDDASIRFRAAIALGRIADTNSVAALVKRSMDSDLFVRFAAFSGLNRIGRGNSAVWPAIALGLQSDRPRVREGTMFALRETYEPPLMRALSEVFRGTGTPAEARAAAVELLAQAHRKPPEWKGEWWAYHPVNSPPPMKTEEWESTAVVHSVLRDALADRELPVRRAAVEGVREAKLSDAAPKLRAMFRTESDLELKRSILASLGVLKDAASVELIAGVFANTRVDLAMADAAVSAAEQITGPETESLLVAFLKSRPADKAILLKTIVAIGRIKANGAAADLANFARDQDLEIRQAVFNSLIGIGGDASATVLSRLLDDSSVEVRRGVVTALGELKARSALPRLLEVYRDAEMKWEVVAALARMPDARALDAYLDGLAGKNPTLRASCRKAIEAIRDMALPAIEAKLTELSPETVAELQKIYTESEAARQGRLFEAKAKKLDPADYLDFALEHEGDVARGRKSFHDLSGVACIKCHRVAGEGSDVGPDLSTAGAQFGRKDLAESVLYPSKAIREGYQRVEVETKNEEMFEGVVKAETNEELTLRDANGNNRRISKADIKDRRNSQLSLMPEGLEAGMSLQDFADLVAYLASLRGQR